MFNHHPTEEELLMSALITTLTALGQQFAAYNAANNNVDNTAHFAAIETHLEKLDAAEGADAATIADTSAALQAFVDAATGGAAAGTPVPTPEPTAAPAPTAGAAS